MIFILLIFMFFLGIVQVVWALIQGLATRQAVVRKHFGIYGAGVAAYFLILFLIVQLGPNDWETPLFGMHFFGGAFFLCCYHIWILALSLRLRETVEPREEWV